MNSSKIPNSTNMNIQSTNPTKKVSSSIHSNTSNINSTFVDKNIPNINPSIVNPSLIPKIKKTLPPLNQDNSLFNSKNENLKNTQILNPNDSSLINDNQSGINNSHASIKNSIPKNGFNNSKNDSSFQPSINKGNNLNQTLSKISEQKNESLFNSQINKSGLNYEGFKNDSNIKTEDNFIQNSKFQNNDDKQSEMTEPEFLTQNFKYSIPNQEQGANNYDTENIPKSEYHNPSIYYQNNIQSSKIDNTIEGSKIEQSANTKIKKSKINNEKEDKKEVINSNLKESNMKQNQLTNSNNELSFMGNSSIYANVSVFNKQNKTKKNFGDNSIYQIRNVNYDEDVDMLENKLYANKVIMDSALDQSKVLEERKKFVEQQKKQRHKNSEDEY